MGIRRLAGAETVFLRKLDPRGGGLLPISQGGKRRALLITILLPPGPQFPAEEPAFPTWWPGSVQ
eukprot:6339568-Prorocentrum_lima.AAC.1